MANKPAKIEFCRTLYLFIPHLDDDVLQRSNLLGYNIALLKQTGCHWLSGVELLFSVLMFIRHVIYLIYQPTPWKHYLCLGQFCPLARATKHASHVEKSLMKRVISNVMHYRFCVFGNISITGYQMKKLNCLIVLDERPCIRPCWVSDHNLEK